MSVRVVLADDHRLVREALREALSRLPDIEVVGEAGTGTETLEVCSRLMPDVVVLDISLPDVSGIDIAAQLVAAHPSVRVVALSQHNDKRYVTAIMRAGAHAYVTKSAAGTELVHAIRAVAGGQGYFAPEVAAVLADEMRGGAASAPTPLLAPRELEVLRLVAEGERTAAIAERLQVSAATVDVHRRNIMRKLGVRTVAELTRFAIREGIVAP